MNLCLRYRLGWIGLPETGRDYGRVANVTAPAKLHESSLLYPPFAPRHFPTPA